MKHLTLSIALALAVSSAQAQRACPSFEYQELKDMPEAELVAEYCLAWDTSDFNIGESTDMLTSGNAVSDMYAVEASKCRNSAKRMERLFVSRGRQEPDFYKAYCK